MTLEKKAKALQRALKRGKMVFNEDLSQINRIYKQYLPGPYGIPSETWVFDCKTSVKGLEMSGLRLVDSNKYFIVQKIIEI